MNQHRSLGTKDKTVSNERVANKRFKPLGTSRFQCEVASDEESLRATNLYYLNLAMANQSNQWQQQQQQQQQTQQYQQQQNQQRLFYAHNAMAAPQLGLLPASSSQGGYSAFSQALPARQSTNPTLYGAMTADPARAYWHVQPPASSPTRVLLDAIDVMARLPTSNPERSLVPMAQSSMVSSQTFAPPNATTKPLALPFCLSVSSDQESLSQFQVFLRRHMEAFAATPEDTMSHTRGRNKKIHVHQVGIRCRHCAHVPAGRRTKGSVYFPASILGVYQAAQNMSSTHLQCGACPEMPDSTKQVFAQLLATKTAGSSSAGGRAYWGRLVQDMGDLVDTDWGIFARHSVPPGARLLTSAEQPHYQNKQREVDTV